MEMEVGGCFVVKGFASRRERLASRHGAELGKGQQIVDMLLKDNKRYVRGFIDASM
jgi:hypothetical protein